MFEDALFCPFSGKNCNQNCTFYYDSNNIYDTRCSFMRFIESFPNEMEEIKSKLDDIQTEISCLD